MKKIQDIQKEVEEINDELTTNKKRKKGEVGFLKPGAVKKLKSRKEYLLTCIAYLNTNPTQEFIEKEKERLMNRNNKIMEGTPSGYGVTRKAKRDYEKLMDLPKIRLQMKTLQFISQ